MRKNFVFICDLHCTSKSNVRTGDYVDDIVKKLEFVVDYANRNDAALLIGGDIFDKPSVPDFVKAAVGRVLIKASHPVYSIWGNHDKLWNADEKDFKTSYNLLAELGVIRDLKTEDFGEFVLTSEKPLQTDGKPKLAMYHGFLNKEDRGWEVMLQDITTTDQAMVLLGHDHVQYEDVEFGPVRVIRPGSFTRVSREETNFRQPVLVHILVDTENDRVFRRKYVEIATARQFDTIFKEKEVSKTAADEASYNSIIQSLMAVTEQDMSFMQAVSSVASPETTEYIKTVLDEVKTDKDNK